jgi:hypothetical protein
VPRGLTGIPGNHGPRRPALSIEYNAGQPGKGGIAGEAMSPSGAAVGRGDTEPSVARVFSGTKKPRTMPGLSSC